MEEYSVLEETRKSINRVLSEINMLQSYINEKQKELEEKHLTYAKLLRYEKELSEGN